MTPLHMGAMCARITAVVEDVLKIKLPNLPGPLEEYLAPWER